MTTLAYPIQELVKLLSTCRYHGSVGEAHFIKSWLEPVTHYHDAAGNLYAITDPDSRTLFSCHTDTCQKAAGDALAQKLTIRGYQVGTNNKWPMGADDGTGIWIMLNLIAAKVPGTYIFHRGEEVGGIGSTWIAKNRPEFLARFDRAIAFDRAGTTDIITHQAGDRCSSDTFAKALGGALFAQDPQLKMNPCKHGVFTDTANYLHVIPECTNLSVGYESQHTNRETQNLLFAERLAKACLMVDWENLPTERDPTKYESLYDLQSWGWGGNSNHLTGLSNDLDEVQLMTQLLNQYTSEDLALALYRQGYDYYELEELLGDERNDARRYS